jgi:peptide/nickel transport system permease protein
MTFSSSLLLARIEGVSAMAQLVFQQNWVTTKIGTSGLFSYNATRWGFSQFYVKGDPMQKGLPETYTEFNYTTSSRTLGLISPQQPAHYDSSGFGYVILKQLFPRADYYTAGIEVTIKKLAPNAEAVIYIDSLSLELKGNAYGLLGTDELGRDVFTQLVYGTRISLVVGLLAAFLSVVIGLVVGLVSAYVGGIVDEVLMRFTDALLVLPGLPLIIVLMTVFSSGQYNMNTFIIIIGFLGWMGFARVVRSQVLSLKERPYVEAAKAVGAGTPYILVRHILPNVVTLVYVTLALSVPSAIVSEAALSFLGFVDVSVMSWGRMLLGTLTRTDLWWLVIPPGIAIAILSLSFILLGYALDEILNPKLRMRR